MKILITGVAGFIGFHVARQLLRQGHTIVGIDNINDYYSQQLKHDRLAQITSHDQFGFEKIDISDQDKMQDFFNRHPDIEGIIHLAAQAGVRYSLENPHAYLKSNIEGHLNILEGARTLPKLFNLVYASSSSVYGGNDEESFSVEDKVDKPLSIYAVTKKTDELMSHCYSHLYNIPSMGLRFFTVYGPWGRPDMTPYVFADAIVKEEPIKVFNHGNMMRDFTYIDDIVDGVISALHRPPTSDEKGVRHKVYNLGNNKSEKLMDYITKVEECFGIEAKKDMLPMQPGDAPRTYANIDVSKKDLGYNPKTTIDEGIPKFVEWYKQYYDL